MVNNSPKALAFYCTEWYHVLPVADNKILQLTFLFHPCAHTSCVLIEGKIYKTLCACTMIWQQVFIQEFH